MNITQIITNLKSNINFLIENANRGMLGPYGNNVTYTCCSNINELSFEFRDKNPKFYNELQEIRLSFFQNYYRMGVL